MVVVNKQNCSLLGGHGRGSLARRGDAELDNKQASIINAWNRSNKRTAKQLRLIL